MMAPVSSSLWGFNANDLISVQVNVNNNFLFETLKKIVEELGSHSISITEINKKVADPNSFLTSSRSSIATKDEVNELRNQMKQIQTENKMFRERMEEMELKLESLGAEAKVRAERHHEEIQEVYTKIIVERESMQAAMRRVQSDWQNSISVQNAEFSDKMDQMKADIESGVNKDLRNQVEHLATEFRNDMDNIKDLVRVTSSKVASVESDIRQLQDEVPLFEKEIEDALHDVRIDMTSMNECRKRDISSSSAQIRKLYDVMNLDMAELTQNDNTSNADSTIVNKTTHVTHVTNITNSSIQSDPSHPEYGRELERREHNSIQSNLEEHKVQNGIENNIEDSLVSEYNSSPVAKGDEMSADKGYIDSQDTTNQAQSRSNSASTTDGSNSNMVRMMLNTPAFVELRRQINREIEIVRNDQSEALVNFEKELQKNTKEARDCISRFITRDDLRQALSNNAEYNEMRDLVRQHERSIRHVLENYWDKEQTWEALRLKADEKNLDLKADRKFVNGLFDYINEKVNSLMGDGSNDKLMGAIRSLEDQLNKKANISDLLEIEKSQTAAQLAVPVPTPRSQPLNDADAPLLLSRGDPNSGESKSFKCLSCNRPLSPKNRQRSPRDHSVRSPRKSTRADHSDKSNKHTEERVPIKYKVRDSGSINPWSQEPDEQYDDAELPRERHETDKSPNVLSLNLERLKDPSLMQPTPPKSAPSLARLKRSKSSGTEYIPNPSIVEVANLGDQIVVGPKSSRQSSLSSIESRRKSTTHEDRTTRFPPL